jgi:hypothetical protein
VRRPGPTSPPDALLESRLHVTADHKHHATETGPLGVEHGVIKYRLAGRPHRVKLLEPAVAAAHACRKNHKGGGFRHRQRPVREAPQAGKFFKAATWRFRYHARAAGLDLAAQEGPGDRVWFGWDREITVVLDWFKTS